MIPLQFPSLLLQAPYLVLQTIPCLLEPAHLLLQPLLLQSQLHLNLLRLTSSHQCLPLQGNLLLKVLIGLALETQLALESGVSLGQILKGLPLQADLLLVLPVEQLQLALFGADLRLDLHLLLLDHADRLPLLVQLRLQLPHLAL